MLVNHETYFQLIDSLKSDNVVLVAVSKTKPVAAIQELYQLGQRDFGENYVQELLEKKEQLPNDIRWHFIGHLQSNKAKYLVPFVYLIHGIDSFKLLREVNKQAEKQGRIQKVLLQVHLAQEETKFGLDEEELEELVTNPELPLMNNVLICGFMGMASLTENQEQIRKEFRRLKYLSDKYKNHSLTNFQSAILSMGMSSDYSLALEEGTNLVRIGSLIFGERG